MNANIWINNYFADYFIHLDNHYKFIRVSQVMNGLVTFNFLNATIIFQNELLRYNCAMFVQINFAFSTQQFFIFYLSTSSMFNSYFGQILFYSISFLRYELCFKY